MQMHFQLRRAIPLLLSVVLTGLTALAIPKALAQSADGHIQYRQDVMRINGSSMGAIGDILKNQLPQRENIATHARIINLSAGLMLSAFREKATEGKTDAKAEIWNNPAGFEAAVKKLQDASAALAKASESGDSSAVMAGVKDLGGACKTCHDDFRKPKEESYKRG